MVKLFSFVEVIQSKFSKAQRSNLEGGSLEADQRQIT